jgi:hypothetical protein
MPNASATAISPDTQAELDSGSAWIIAGFAIAAVVFRLIFNRGYGYERQQFASVADMGPLHISPYAMPWGATVACLRLPRAEDPYRAVLAPSEVLVLMGAIRVPPLQITDL